MKAKPFLKSKTIWVAIGSIIAGTFEYMTGAFEAGNGLSWTLILSGVVHTALRFVTNGPVSIAR